MQAVATTQLAFFLILTTRCQSNLNRIVEFPRLHIKTLTQVLFYFFHTKCGVQIFIIKIYTTCII